MKKTIYLYRLIDGKGNQHVVVVDDPSDDGCISGEDAAGKWYQFDGNQLYNAYDWAKEHGFVLESAETEIDIPDTVFKPVASLKVSTNKPAIHRCRVCGDEVADEADMLRVHLEGHSHAAMNFSFEDVLNSFVKLEGRE